MSRHRGHRGAVLGIAAGGVLVGHWLTYRLVSPHPHAREALLAQTGHGYLGLANDLGLALATIALASVVFGRLIDHDGGVTIRHWFRRLVGLSVASFFAMEVLERLTTGAPFTDLLHQGILPVGMAIQVVVAAVGALAVHWLLRAVDRLHEILAAAAETPRLVLVADAPVGWHPPLRPVPAADAIRGPPLVR